MANRRKTPATNEKDPGLAELGLVGGLFTMRLQRVEYLFSRATRAVWGGKELRSGAIGSLSLIVANPGMSQSDIVKNTTFDKSAVNGIVNNLEELGWAERRRSESDRRRYAIFPTDKGKKAIQRIVDRINIIETRMLSFMDEDDREKLLTLLDALHDSFIKISD